MNNSLQLWWCDQATGKDHLRDTTGMTEAQVRQEFQSASEKGGDVWLIHPDGRKELPSGPTPQAEHTPEPWFVAKDGAFNTMVRSDNPETGRKLLGTWVQGNPKSYEANLRQAQVNEANAFRIVACVNALAGVDDPSAVLKGVREALEECEGDLLCYAGDSKYPAKAATLKRVTAALAKLGGKA